ncbi:extracellular solute-binding protein [Candidatus Sumerlaeota bacterium]|nr:extracellular solute-binding protein [Candidatus Sumerlaeota bacterium]
MQIPVICALAAGALLACGGMDLPPRVAEDGAIHLSCWQSYNTEEIRVFDELVARFEAEYAERHPGEPPVVIDSEAVPFDNMDQQLSTTAQSGRTPDIVRLDYNKIIMLAFGQVAVPVEEIGNFGALFPGEDMLSLRNRFVGAAYDACLLWRLGERHLYALPEQVTCLALMWNRALFRARRDAIEAEAERTGLPLSHEQPPRTWEELAALGRALTWQDEGRQRYGFGMRDSLWFSLPILAVHGVEVISQDPETGHLSCNLASSERAAILFGRMRDFYLGDENGPGFEGGAWSAGSDRTDRGFENGSYAMVQEGSWQLRRYRDVGLDFGVAPIPRLSDAMAERLGIPPEENIPRTNLGGAGMCVLRTAQLRGVDEQALEFMAWWTSPEVQAEWALALGQIPVTLEAQRMIEDQVDDRARAFLILSRNAAPMPRVPNYATLENDVYNTSIQRVYSGDLEPHEALRRMERDINREILSLVRER